MGGLEAEAVPVEAAEETLELGGEMEEEGVSATLVATKVVMAAEEVDVKAVETAAAVTVERAEMEGGMGWEVLLEMVGTPVQCTEYC